MTNFGSNNFKKYIQSLKFLYPSNCSNYFDKALVYFKQLENNPKTFLHSSISMSSWSKNVKLTTQEINYMNDNSLRNNS